MNTSEPLAFSSGISTNPTDRSPITIDRRRTRRGSTHQKVTKGRVETNGRHLFSLQHGQSSADQQPLRNVQQRGERAFLRRNLQLGTNRHALLLHLQIDSQSSTQRKFLLFSLERCVHSSRWAMNRRRCCVFSSNGPFVLFGKSSRLGSFRKADG